MEPLVVTTGWQTYTPAVAELLQHAFSQKGKVVIQVVQGALSVANDSHIGALVDVQGTFLRPGESMTVIAGTIVRYRLAASAASAGKAVLGRNPA